MTLSKYFRENLYKINCYQEAFLLLIDKREQRLKGHLDP